jgi:ribosome-binding factor A
MNKRREGSASAKGPTQRQLRVGEEIRHVLADLFRRGEFRDPELRDLNVTVSEVRISPDLKNATAFVIPLGGGQPELIEALNRAAPFLRGQVARLVRMQHVPRLGFQSDTSFDYAAKIGRILHDPAVARDLGAGAEEQAVETGDPAEDADHEDRQS